MRALLRRVESVLREFIADAKARLDELEEQVRSQRTARVLRSSAPQADRKTWSYGWNYAAKISIVLSWTTRVIFATPLWQETPCSRKPDPSLRRDFFDMELRWLKLARSYQLTEQLRTFTAHNKQQRGELTERLQQLRHKLETGSSNLANKLRH